LFAAIANFTTAGIFYFIEFVVPVAGPIETFGTTAVSQLVAVES
jgi:hypothetical protein